MKKKNNLIILENNVPLLIRIAYVLLNANGLMAKDLRSMTLIPPDIGFNSS